jgi:hypothetical protein
MRNQIVAMTAAVFCAGAITAAQNAGAQGQPGNPDQSQAGAQTESRTTAAQAAQGMTTLTGCVYREEDVPGRTPNVAERVGILEDYILAEVSMAGAPGQGAGSGAATGVGATATAGSSATADRPEASAGAQARTESDAGQGQRETAGTTGAGAPASQVAQHPMYKLEHEDDDRLQALVGKRVEVTGRIDAEEGDFKSSPTAAAGSGVKPAEDRSVGPDRIELPEFEISSIREIEGTCPASPSTR